MKQLFRCEYCDFTGTDEEVIQHEEKCFHNYTKKSCSTCNHKETKGLNYKCTAGKDIPDGQMYVGCDKYEWDEKDHVCRLNSPFHNLFGGIF